MPTLATDLRNQLERVVVEARDAAEIGARAALEALAVHHHEPYTHMKPAQRELRNHLRARARQLGDRQDGSGRLGIDHLVAECAYEHWHRMLFARFLAENHLLIEPEMAVAVSLDEVKELAKEEKIDLWTLAGRYAQKMLPEVFRADDPVLQVLLAREDQLKLEELLDSLARETFTASDSLGWCYQFWQKERKEQVNDSGNKIGADELPAVTQLFTEDYMVDFLLDNTLGAWHAGRVLAANPKLAENAQSEGELRKAVALPGCPWKYLRLIRPVADKSKTENPKPKIAWAPAAGTFDGWPKNAKEIRAIDPCCGSGHFIVGMFERLVALRMAEEKLDEQAAVAAVIHDNLFGLELDPRCTQIAAFNLALAAWRRVGHCALPPMNIACSGLAPNAREIDWVALAGDNENLQRGMARLHRLFQNAPVLGSLINPRVGEGDLFMAAFHELQPLMERALAQETKDDTAHEMAVTARGLTKAAEILAGQFTLVATNVPFLATRRQSVELLEFLHKYHHAARYDLATSVIERCLLFAESKGTTAIVSPHNWLFLGSFATYRERLLEDYRWNVVSKLGPGAFETISGEVVNVCMTILSSKSRSVDDSVLCSDAQAFRNPAAKAESLAEASFQILNQTVFKRVPDARIAFDSAGGALLSAYASGLAGIINGDAPRFERYFSELPARFGDLWHFEQGTILSPSSFGGREKVLFFDKANGHLREEAIVRREKLHDADQRGRAAWENRGVCVSLMGDLLVSLYLGDLYDQNTAVILPADKKYVLPIWALCESGEFSRAVRSIDQAIKVTNSTLVKIPFDLAHWQKVAAEKYPHGLPKPFSSDPTQWLFNGHPAGADQPLHVAVARLLGYQWPRQTGSRFPDCPTLGPDGLEKLADDDGIVCLPSVRGEEPASERLNALLGAAGIKPAKVRELAGGTDLDDWLRNEFFQEHCEVFHQRPFIWHIWDGRKRDGFHALINYHKLCEGSGKGRRLLESLTYAYLGDWITRQKDGVKRDEEGSEDRLAAAVELQNRLKVILEGEPPFDIFVRWKPLHKQPLGWEPDINDGVRMNIRPFLASDLPGGKKGAGILRCKPNIKWEKDRGKEPERPKAEHPWFWGWDEKTEDFTGGKQFDGNRWNDCHYTNKAKQAARDVAKKGNR